MEIKGKVATAIAYGNVIEDAAIEQIRRMCDYAFTEGSKIRIMPDAVSYTHLDVYKRQSWYPGPNWPSRARASTCPARGAPSARQRSNAVPAPRNSWGLRGTSLPDRRC